MNAAIELRLYATLGEYAREDTGRLAISPGSTVADVARSLGIPLDKIKLVFIDGARADLDSILQGGERVGKFPPVGGG